MGRKAKLKQQRRIEQRKEIAKALKSEKANLLSRRNFIVSGLAVAIFGVGALAYNLSERERHPAYEQALMNESKREKWVEGLVSKVNVPDYVNISYADEEKYRKLKKEYPGQIAKPEDTFAVSIIQNEQNLARGAKTDIYISHGCFLELYKKVPEAWKDLELIIKNVATQHELLHADHFHHGISEYHLENFYSNDRTLNKSVFMAVSEMLCHQREFKGLLDNRSKATSQMFWFYLKNLPLLSAPYYNQLCNPKISEDLNSNFVSKLRTDLNPKTLFI